MESIYLDYNATTPCDPQVLEKMMPFFNTIYGNPANGFHIQGRRANKAVENARNQTASLIGSRPFEIIFTSGATESDNIAVLGVARAARSGNRKQIVTSAIEHKAILQPCKKLQEDGFEIVFLPVDEHGRVSIEAAKATINQNTLLVSIQIANNEIGTIQPVAEISTLAHQNGAFVHCDAAQGIGKIPVDVNEVGVDLLSISAHKFYGPKGVGALYIRGGIKSIPIEPLFFGGGQEYDIRSGTSNVPGIVGLGEACQISQKMLSDEFTRIKGLRDHFEGALLENIDLLRINACQADRLPNTSSLTFHGIDADALLLNMPDLMLGTGSACTSGAIEPSHVLQAIGLSREDASSTIRVCLGRFTSNDDIIIATKLITSTWKALKF